MKPARSRHRARRVREFDAFGQGIGDFWVPHSPFSEAGIVNWQLEGEP
jgi:hypothetical protein